LNVFDDSWLGFLHCLIWRLGEVDEWLLHRIVYELSERKVIEVNNWTWFGKWPRSAEVDAAVALLEMVNAVEGDSNVIKAVKPPVKACELDDQVEAIIEEVVRKYRNAT